MAKTYKKRRTRQTPLDDVTPALNSISADVNTKGLPTFPMELHLEILSYIASVPIPYMGFGILPEEYRVKFDVMHALSQTCRALYHMLRPILWHTLGACALPRTGRAAQKSKAMATELVFWMEVATVRAPALGSLVRVFNVALTAYSSGSVYQEFARCLGCLANLHTLQIVAFPNGVQERDRLEHLYDSFHDVAIPSLQTLTLPYFVFDRLMVNRMFPNLRHLALTGMSLDLNNHFHNSDANPSEIHTLYFTPPPQMKGLERFVERFPHLRAAPRLELAHYESYWEPSQDLAAYRANYLGSVRQAFKAISQLKRLHSVEPVIDIEHMERKFRTPSNDVDPLIVEGVFTIARNFVLGNLNRDENRDVLSGTVKLWVGDQLWRSCLVTRPVKE